MTPFDRLLRRFLRLLLVLLHRFRCHGEEHARVPGPVLLVPNHVSWLDFLMVGACLEEDWRFVTSSVAADRNWAHRLVMRSGRTFPVDAASPYSLKEMAQYLKSGGRLVIFAEGRISDTGSLMKLYEGIGFLLLRTGARVIPCHLHGADRSVWARHRGRKRLLPRLSVHFGEPLSPPAGGREGSRGREELTAWLRARMIEQQYRARRSQGARTVLEALCRNRRLHPGVKVLEDTETAGQGLSYRRLLAGMAILARRWPRFLSGREGDRVGVLLPNVNAAPVVLGSLWAHGRVPALLNFSTGPALMLSCCRLAGIREVITSRRFLGRAGIDPGPLEAGSVRMVYLEDVRGTVGPLARIGTLLGQMIVPPFRKVRPDPRSAAAILFTSGSEGTPKGVELTHDNLMANIGQMLSAIDIEDHDRLFNALPLFHSFGLTVGTLLPLVRGIPVFLYPSPLHYRMVPAAVYDRRSTILLGTNTFLNGYARKAHPYDFATLRFLFAGAEKVQESTFGLWARRFGVRILEGYGVTECSPCISVNTRVEPRPGTAGRLLPAIEARIEPVEGIARGGRLLVRGPNVMGRYLNPEADRAFQALGGWYDTGDVAEVDSGGYVRLLGRLKRFAKVSGEMISLGAVEEALAGRFGRPGARDAEVAVVARPDPVRGERLVAVTDSRALSLEDVHAALREAGQPNLALPRSLEFVDEIPKLGTGKVAHRLLEQELARRAQEGEGKGGSARA